jgi:hypothetical protein
MKTQSESVHVPKDTRIARDDTRTNNPRLRTVHDLRFWDVFVTHSRSTR